MTNCAIEKSAICLKENFFNGNLKLFVMTKVQILVAEATMQTWKVINQRLQNNDEVIHSAKSLKTITRNGG